MGSALPDIQVLVDWQNNPIGATATAGNNFTDISSYVKVSAGVSITRGRQDNISNVQPSRCTFTVHNDDGRFTPGNLSSPYAPVIGRRVQVNVRDEVGTYHTRFDGMIAEYDINDTPTGEDTTVQIICTDVLAFLNRFPAFSCWAIQEIANQAGTQPAFQYLCNEDSSAGVLRDATGNNQPLTPATYSNPPFSTQSTASGVAYWDSPAIQLQAGTPPVEASADPLSWDSTQGYGFPVVSPIASPLPSLYCSQTLQQGTGPTPTSSAASAQFGGTLTNPVTIAPGRNYTLIGWLRTGRDMSVTTVQNPFEAICLSNTRTGAMLSIGTDVSGGDVTFRARYYPDYLKASPASTSTGGADTGTYFILGAAVMVAAVITGTSVSFYVGANEYKRSGEILLTGGSTVTVPSGTVFNYLSIGGPIGGGNGWFGNISLVTMFNADLTTSIGTIATWGNKGSEGVPTGDVAQRAAFDYTGVPSYWQGTVDNGLSVCDYFDINGSNPSTVLQDVQSVEHGLVYVDAAGKLNFHDRSRRMGATTSPVTLPAGSYNAGVAPRVNDQFLNNYASYQNLRGGSGIVAQNADSIARYGVYPNGSITSPQQAPYNTFAYSVKVLEAATPNPGISLYNDRYTTGAVQDAASWDVNVLGDPALKLASVTVDRLGNTAGQDEYVAPSVLYGLEIDQPVIIGQNLPWWPDSPMSSELFIEGINDTYSTTEASVMFYTTPAFQSRAWIPGNSSYGQLDVSARVGIADMTGLGGDTLLCPSPPAYTSSMNLGGGAAGFIGATDQLGISGNLQRVAQPPLLFVTQKTVTQSFGGLGGSSQFIVWDNLLLDTQSGFNFANEGGISYSVMVSGWYEIYATVVFATSSGALFTVVITQNQTQAANLRQLAPVSARGPSSGDLGISTSAVAYCYAGDNISVSAFTDSGTWTTSTGNGGSSLSLRYLGQGTSRN